MAGISGVANQKFHVEEYVKIWTIPKWDSVQRSEEALKAQIFDFETGRSNRGQTIWIIGFKMRNQQTGYGVYWKMKEEKGFPGGEVDATVTYTFLNVDSRQLHYTHTQKIVMEKGQELEVPPTITLNSDGWGSWINQKGELTIELKLVINEPEIPPVDVILELFHKFSVSEVHANFAKLLQDKSTADLKIVTSDEKELFAHRAILKVQCPVFESMFSSKFSEATTGIVNVKDINAKTMEIFLHYFYSGELLSSWKDRDTVVEFTYAVGKYQLANILELLDKILGSRDEEDATHADIQLLDLARKLGLKNAEKELVERIKSTTNKAKSGADLFGLYGLE